MTVRTTSFASDTMTRIQRQKERQRQFAVRAVFFIFFLSLIEGPLRKWFMPGLAAPLTLLRDPFVIALYVYCLIHGMMWIRGIGKLWIAFAVVTSVFGLLQYAANGIGLAGWALGVRTYWLYMPLMLVVARTFQPEDLQRFFRLVLMIAVPYCFLVAMQYSSPSNSLVNLGVAGDPDAAVGVGLGFFRPFGLFSYSGLSRGYTVFTIAVFIAYYLLNEHIQFRPIFLLVTGAAVGTMSVLTGTRSIYFLAGAILFGTIFGLLASKPDTRSLKRIAVVLCSVGLTALLFVVVFGDMLAAMGVRFESAARSEGSIWNRAVGGLIKWVEPLTTAPFFGHGIGAGAPGVARYLGLPALIYGESDLQRNINELGILFGTLLLLLRWFTAIWFYLLALRLARKGEIYVLPLSAFLMQPFVMGQITHSPTTAFLPWLAAGMLLATAQNLKKEPQI